MNLNSLLNSFFSELYQISFMISLVYTTYVIFDIMLFFVISKNNGTYFPNFKKNWKLVILSIGVILSYIL